MSADTSLAYADGTDPYPDGEDPYPLENETVEDWMGSDPLGLDEDSAQLPEADELYPRAYGPLETARKCHDALAPMRERRRLVRNFVSSLQYLTYTDPDTGEEVDEEREIRDQGRYPWTMNRMRPVLRQLRGQLRGNASDRTPFAVELDDQQTISMMAEAHKAVRRTNQSRVLDADGLAEFAISGISIRRAQDGFDDERDRNEVLDDPVHPNRFFLDVEGAEDRRLKGVTVFGELLDCPPDEVVREFCPTPQHEMVLRSIYGTYGEGGTLSDVVEGYDPYDPYGAFDALDGEMGEESAFDRFDEIDFYRPHARGRWRVIVVWRLEGAWRTWYADPLVDAHMSEREWLEMEAATGNRMSAGELTQAVEQENAMRAASGELPIERERRYDRLWVRYTLTPEGHQLQRSEQPFWHGGHPYSVALHEFTDGEVYGFLFDLIDPQRQLNRLYTQIDAMLTQAPKGMWAIPEEVIPEGMSKEEFSSEFTRHGSMLFYNLEQLQEKAQVRGGDAANLIKAIQPHAIPASIFHFLEMQNGYMDALSSHGGAMRGETPGAGTPASLYAQMISQSSIGTLDMFESYFESLQAHDAKLLQCIMQFWTEARAVRASATSPTVVFDPEAVRGFEWDVSVAKTTETATYRMLFEQDMKEFLTAGLLTFKQFLTESSHPRARALLQLIEQTNPLLEAQASGDPAAAELLAQFTMAAQAGDPEAMAMLKQAQGWHSGVAMDGDGKPPLGTPQMATPSLNQGARAPAAMA
ncbi:MAG: hypothetical protein AAFQ43_00880 [Bacteroidota bacterium]